MKNSKYFNGVHVMPGSKAYELLSSRTPEDLKTVKRLMEYSKLAAECFYEHSKIAELRVRFSDVV